MLSKLIKPLRIIVIFLLFLIGINALIAGFLFILQPSGALMGMNTEVLEYSPFANFLIPGIILFTFNGIFNITVAILCIRKFRYYPFLIIFQALILAGWILVQIIMIQIFNALHVFMLSSALILFITGILFTNILKTKS